MENLEPLWSNPTWWMCHMGIPMRRHVYSWTPSLNPICSPWLTSPSTWAHSVAERRIESHATMIKLRFFPLFCVSAFVGYTVWEFVQRQYRLKLAEAFVMFINIWFFWRISVGFSSFEIKFLQALMQYQAFLCLRLWGCERKKRDATISALCSLLCKHHSFIITMSICHV